MTYKPWIIVGALWLAIVFIQVDGFQGAIGIQVPGAALPSLKALLIVAYICFYLGWIVPLGLGLFKLLRAAISKR